MKVLVTGGAGFIGSNYVRLILRERPEDSVVNVDALTYAGNLENLADVLEHPRHVFARADVASREAMEHLFDEHPDIEAVVHFAAETHVDRSLHVGVDAFIQTNILGTQVLLDACRARRHIRLVHVSTDEVYGSLGPEGRFTEQTPLAPNNPYAATKAGADFLVHAAAHSHGLDALITRCSNNFGPYQFPEKLIPLMIANALENKPLPVYGDGMQVRDWIYVEDHCRGIDTVLRAGRTGRVYNIGSMHDMPNLELVRKLLALLDRPETLIRHVTDRPGHDRRYAMDASRIQHELGWSPRYGFDEALQKTIDWYLSHGEWLERVRSGEYTDYYENMYARR